MTGRNTSQESSSTRTKPKGKTGRRSASKSGNQEASSSGRSLRPLSELEKDAARRVLSQLRATAAGVEEELRNAQFTRRINLLTWMVQWYKSACDTIVSLDPDLK